MNATSIFLSTDLVTLVSSLPLHHHTIHEHPRVFLGAHSTRSRLFGPSAIAYHQLDLVAILAFASMTRLLAEMISAW
jgi:hypothetical protein